jgi:hypothetical protein
MHASHAKHGAVCLPSRTLACNPRAFESTRNALQKQRARSTPASSGQSGKPRVATRPNPTQALRPAPRESAHPRCPVRPSPRAAAEARSVVVVVGGEWGERRRASRDARGWEDWGRGGEVKRGWAGWARGRARAVRDAESGWRVEGRGRSCVTAAKASGRSFTAWWGGGDSPRRRPLGGWARAGTQMDRGQSGMRCRAPHATAHAPCGAEGAARGHTRYGRGGGLSRAAQTQRLGSARGARGKRRRERGRAESWGA